MGDVYFVIIPVVIVVVVLKLCLICWRIWLYQKRRERVYVHQTQVARSAPPQPTARIVGVERTLGPEGYTQRTAYVINERGVPPRRVTRTVTIRPREAERTQDPNMPPTYHQAVTGKDKSVKVDTESQQQQQQQQEAQQLQQVPRNAPPRAAPPSLGPSSVQPSAPSYSAVAAPRAQQPSGGLPPPPAYSAASATPSAPPPVARFELDGDSNSLDAEDTTRLLA